MNVTWILRATNQGQQPHHSNPSLEIWIRKPEPSIVTYFAFAWIYVPENARTGTAKEFANHDRSHGADVIMPRFALCSWNCVWNYKLKFHSIPLSPFCISRHSLSMCTEKLFYAIQQLCILVVTTWRDCEYQMKSRVLSSCILWPRKVLETLADFSCKLFSLFMHVNGVVVHKVHRPR